MLSKISLLLFVTVAFSSIYSGVAIKCYQCRSTESSDFNITNSPIPIPSYNKGCEDASDLKSTECGEGLDQCLKVSFDHGDDTIVVRTCGVDKSCDAMTDLLEQINIEGVTCDSCDSDECNSSTSIASSILLTIAAYFIIRNY